MQKADDGDHDRIVARQEGNQHAGKDVAARKRLRQPPFLAGDIDEAGEAGAGAGYGRPSIASPSELECRRTRAMLRLALMRRM